MKGGLVRYACGSEHTPTLRKASWHAVASTGGRIRPNDPADLSPSFSVYVRSPPLARLSPEKVQTLPMSQRTSHTGGTTHTSSPGKSKNEWNAGSLSDVKAAGGHKCRGPSLISPAREKGVRTPLLLAMSALTSRRCSTVVKKRVATPDILSPSLTLYISPMFMGVPTGL